MILKLSPPARQVPVFEWATLGNGDAVCTARSAARPHADNLSMAAMALLQVLPCLSSSRMPLCRAPQEKEFEACKASAAGMLAFRPHTRSELTTKLTDKGYDKACIERSINRLQELVRPALSARSTHSCRAWAEPVDFRMLHLSTHGNTRAG